MERHPASRSLWGLDWLNFSMADVLNGLGPFLAVFLKGARHWGAGDIGTALAVSSIAGALSQVPIGMLVDSTRKKRRLVALAGLLIAAGCLTIAIHPTYSWVIGAQIVIGTASAVLPPALAALCLGLVGRRRLPKQLGRNQGCSHAGAFTSAILIGAGRRVWGYDWIFYLVCIFAVGTVASVIIAADLTRGTGRFNLAQGLVALSVGIGAGLSNLTAGFVVQSFGFPIGFLYLAGIAVCGLMFFATMMPETRPADDSGAVKSLADGRR